MTKSIKCLLGGLVAGVAQCWRADQAGQRKHHDDSHGQAASSHPALPSPHPLRAWEIVREVAGSHRVWLGQFDDLTGSAISDSLTTSYQSLRFTAFDLVESKPDLDELLPRSAPNFAAAPVQRQLETGAIPTIDTAYPGSTVTSFDLQSLYFGCTASSITLAFAAISCTVQITGTKAGTGATVGPQLFDFALFNRAGITLQQTGMTLATLAEMNDLSSVTLQVVLNSVPAGKAPIAVLFIDDLVHTNHP
ncbi:MAG: hypothetical protein M1826_000202 [Phylliscum demangeonii]|nr:MAG: hypothetical protein M1826_000202 [Phylliscum demangeonii]